MTYTQAEQYSHKLKSLGLIAYLEQEEPIKLDTLKNRQNDGELAKNIAPMVRKTVYNQTEEINTDSNSVIESPAIWCLDFSGRYGRLNFINVQLILTLLFDAPIIMFIVAIGNIGEFIKMMGNDAYMVS